MRKPSNHLPLVICSLVIGLVALLATEPAQAQAPVGTVSGVVRDITGGVIVGATITLTSLSTGATRTTTTNESGFYNLPTLLPGEYRMTIEYPGFATYGVERVVVEVGQIRRIDAVLSVKESKEIVQVEAEQVARIETFQSTIGGVVNVRQIDQLPLNGRNYLELARLQPGVEIQEGRAFDITKSRYTGISVAGRQGREARITIDGIDAVDEHVGTTTINISQDSIQEFAVATSSADKSTGVSATGAVNIITRRGSNELHGTGFIYGRSSSWAARPSVAPTKPEFDRQQYGGNLGGPLVKDRLFLFGNFEKTNEDSAISIDTPYFPSLTSYPAPFDERSSTARLDWRLPRGNDFFSRWSRNDNANLGGFGGNAMPSNANVNKNQTQQFVWGLDSAFSARITNGFRAAFTDFKNRVVRPPLEAQKLTIPGLEEIRIVTDDGLLITGPNNITPQSTFEQFSQFRDDLTFSIGDHTFRMGVDIVYRKVQVTNYVNGFPQFNANAPASRNPADIENSTFVSFVIGNRNGKRIPGTPDNSHRNTRFGIYLDDLWRLRRNLTLSAGLRYEVDTHPLNNDLPKPSLAKPVMPRGTAPTPIDKNNVAPHLGIAWDPFSNGKTSIRAGFGIYYAMRVSNLVTNERATIAPFNSGNDTISLTRGTSGIVDFNKDGVADYDFTPALLPGVTIKQAIPIVSAGQKVYIAAPPGTEPTLNVTRTGVLLSNDLVTPYSQQANAGFQREFPLGVVADVNFIWSRTVHEFMRDIDIANLFPGNGTPIILGDGLPPTRQIQATKSDGFSTYRALTARIDKRLANRYQLTASYALSRIKTTLPDGLGLGGGTLVNRNLKANYGPGALDRTHRLTLNGIVELPLGFRASMIMVFNSGLPQTLSVGSADLNGDGINGDLLPGTGRGSLGRTVKTPAALNALIRNYNLSNAGKTLPRGGRAPFLLEVPDFVTFGDSFMSQDLQITKVFKFKENFNLELTAQVFNLFNVSNLVGSGGLPSSPFNGTLTVVSSDSAGKPSGFTLGAEGSLFTSAGARALAGIDRASGFASLGAIRPSIPTGTGLPRALQLGVRFTF
jgi:hypothetical protein